MATTSKEVEKTDVKGSVMVVGGGISGIQSSIDLADSGFKVYLVDKGLSIGGKMTQLDKTFPTNDCSMCILAPKLVNTGRHSNIDIITNAEVRSVEGGPGNFKVELKKAPRFVDPEECNGCGDCIEYCPVEMPADFEEGIGDRKAIFQPFPQAVPNIFSIDKKEERAPCRIECPAGLNAQAFITLAAQKRYAEAYNLIKEQVPLPGSMGRVCYHPCENECNRKDIDEPVSIARIRRYIADWAYENPEEVEAALREREKNYAEIEDWSEAEKRGNQRKVAVVGAGPSGLTAAHDLSEMGYDVTVFEAEENAGGMLYYGVPSYRLPNDYLVKEIEQLIENGNIKIEYGKKLGEDFTVEDLEEQGFLSVYLAIGCWRSKEIEFESCSPECVVQGIDFLYRANSEDLSKEEIEDKKVLVIGGGNVAMDCARTAERLGGDVTVVYRRTQEQMPAHEEEIEQAKEEGVDFEILASPMKMVEDESSSPCLKCQKMELGELDESGRRRPVALEGEVSDIPCDLVIFAIGQEVDKDSLDGSDIGSDWDTIKADPITYQTSSENVFAGGDAVTGPASAVEAIGAGHQAAESIDRYLNNEDLREGREPVEEEGADIPDHVLRIPEDREEPEIISEEKRMKSFQEMESTYSSEQLLKEAERCMSCGGCCECFQCVEHCQKAAIDHEMEEEKEIIEVGSVILSPGSDTYEPPRGDSLGYGIYPDVLTSIEFERMLSASGPFKGHIKRLSDGEEPKKIAWLQCVGSRDESCDHLYCSSVCCMYSIKEAVIAKEHLPGLDTHIYFMDMRTFGKDFEKYYERAEDEYGVVFRRSRVPRVERNKDSGELIVRYIEDDGTVTSESYDMIVLSVGLQPCESMKDLASAVDVNLDGYGFVDVDPYYGVETSKPGVYVSGSITEPKDIPESVIEASAAAAKAASDIREARGTEVVEKEYPRERDVSNEFPRTGVFLCHCGINIGGVIDIPEVADHVRTLPYVAYVDDETFACSQDSLERIKEKIEELGLNRIVVASCTPRTHEPLFQDTLKEAGLNPHLFELVNMRDQNSWVHREHPERATEKAKECVAMGVSRVNEMRPVPHEKFPVIKEALVIGGGLSGMSSALSLADQDFKVHLVEKEEELGGLSKDVHIGLRDEDPQRLLQDTISKTMDNHNIELYLDAELEEIEGYVGNFTSTVRNGDSSETIEHGVVVVATGAEEYEPTTEYRYDESDNIMSQKDLEKDIASGAHHIKDIDEAVMIQCVGSRNDENPYCSRVCCSNALKNAIKIKEMNEDAAVYVLYRDIRTYGFKEDLLYKKARDLGVFFIRFQEDQEPEVSVKDGEITVTTKDLILQREVVLHPDKLFLSTGIVPKDNNELAQQLKVPLNADGFYSEAHMKLRPVEFSADGIYLCGLAHSPRFMDESIAQAQGAAAKAATILSRDHLETSGNIAEVSKRKCAGCQLCVGVCPYEAIEFQEDERIVVVNEILCQGCGACSAVCPSGTAEQKSFTKKQIMSMIDECIR